MDKKRILVSVSLGVGVIALWLLVYSLRVVQLDSYVDNMDAAVASEESEKKVKGIKVVIDGEKYTTEEFMKLDEFPVTAEVVLAYDDGSMDTKGCYISFNKTVTDFTYKDGIYGRILLPINMYKESKDAG